jgi:hypothetical protein
MYKGEFVAIDFHTLCLLLTLSVNDFCFCCILPTVFKYTHHTSFLILLYYSYICSSVCQYYFWVEKNMYSIPFVDHNFIKRRYSASQNKTKKTIIRKIDIGIHYNLTRFYLLVVWFSSSKLFGQFEPESILDELRGVLLNTHRWAWIRIFAQAGVGVGNCEWWRLKRENIENR